MLTKDQDEKEINYMGLSELMRMIIIFVTFCLNKKKKIPQGLRGKKYTNQFSLQSKGAVYSGGLLD